MKKIEVGNDGIEIEVEMTTREKIETLIHDISTRIRCRIAASFLKWYAGKSSSKHFTMFLSGGRRASINIDDNAKYYHKRYDRRNEANL